MLGTKILEERKSKFNGNLRVVKTLGMGTHIQAEGLTQSGGIVEKIWKQTIHHFGQKFTKVGSCLILGLGGGTVAELVKKKYPDVKITGIEIDPLMVELGKKYLRLDKISVDIKIKDALRFVTQEYSSKKTKYDLIIIDLYNGDEYPWVFETPSFLERVKTILADNGVAIFNRLYYGDKRPQAVKFGNQLKTCFNSVDWFYPEANLMFLCSK